MTSPQIGDVVLKGNALCEVVAARLAKQDYSPMQALAMRSLKGGVCV